MLFKRLYQVTKVKLRPLGRHYNRSLPFFSRRAKRNYLANVRPDYDFRHIKRDFSKAIKRSVTQEKGQRFA
jgi:hypothetical protein